MVQLYLSYAGQCGIAPEALCAAAGFTERQLGVGGAYVPYFWLWTIRREIIRRRPGVSVGLELGLHFSAAQRGYMHEALKHAETPRSALSLWNQMVLLVHRGVADGPSLRDDGTLVSWCMPKLAEEPSEAFECLFVAATESFRAATGQALVPRAVHFTTCRPEHLAGFEALFRAPVHTGQHDDAMIFDRALVDRPIARADLTDPEGS